MRILLAITSLGFLISAVVHFATYFGIDLPESHPFIWALQVGAILIILPIGLIALLLPRGANGRASSAFAPKWMGWVVAGSGINLLANFMIVILVVLLSGSPREYRGQYFIRSHGQSRQITQAEYLQYDVYAVRAFSGFWMFFYSLGVMMLASVRRYLRAVCPKCGSRGGFVSDMGMHGSCADCGWRF
jgi:hypothetical protein